jgi:opacity protein-like surface antigen
MKAETIARTARFSSLVTAIVLIVFCAAHSQAQAFDREQVFHKGTFIASFEGGFGQADTGRIPGNLQIWNLGARFAFLPFEPVGHGRLHGALELGLEPFYQRYRTLKENFGGLAIVARYHFLDFGRLVPYVEGTAAAGGTDLRISGLHSQFTFLLNAGVGASYFISDNIAPYVGFRFQHVSNAYLQPPDYGFQAYTMVVGVSYFIP